MTIDRRINLFFYLMLISCLNGIVSPNKLETISKKFDAIIENIDIVSTNSQDKMIAKREITTNRQILILPSRNVMTSEASYQFKEFFSKNNKEKLVGRLLIEKFIGSESYFHEFIENLQKPDKLLDFYHYTPNNRLNFQRRSLYQYKFPDRKIEYDSLISRSKDIPTLLLNWELYNWASSIVQCYGIGMKLKYFNEVKRLYRIVYTADKNEEVILIPGLELFKSGPFKQATNVGNNLVTSLFAYKDHIYLNSDRYFDEGEQVFNELQFMPNIKLFEYCGTFVNGYVHEEMIINVVNKSWTLKKFNLCTDLECFSKGSTSAAFTLKLEFNYRFLTYCQVDTVDDEVDPKIAFKLLSANKKISDINYFKALASCSNILQNYLLASEKTSIVEDIRDLVTQNYEDERDLNILKFSISQKRIINYHTKLFTNRIIKEIHKDMKGIKSKYI